MREEDLAGTTLKVYVYMLDKRGPVGPRDLMRELNLSSPSVAYYHLNKLNKLGLIEKTPEGYVVKEKVNVEGFIWIGRKLVSRLLIYSLFFLGLFLIELTTVFIYLKVNAPLTTELVSLIVVTLLAMLIFIFEGIVSIKRLKK